MSHVTPKKLNPAKAILTVVLVAGAALTLLAGCGGGDTPSKQNSHAKPNSSAPASPRALSEATDGTNLAACRDANCAVYFLFSSLLPFYSSFFLVFIPF